MFETVEYVPLSPIIYTGEELKNERKYRRASMREAMTAYNRHPGSDNWRSLLSAMSAYQSALLFSKKTGNDAWEITFYRLVWK